MPDFLTIKRQHDAAKLKGLISQDSSLADFAKLGALATDDPSYQQVAESPAWKNMIRGWSANVDEAIQSGPIDDWTAGAFGAVGDLFGVTPEASRAAGRELPRQVLNFLPMMAGGAVGGFLGAPGGPAGIAAGAAKGGSIGLGLTSGLSAFDAYGKEGTAASAAIGGVAPYLGTKLAHMGTQAVFRNAATPGSTLSKLGFLKGKDILNPGTFQAVDPVTGLAKTMVGETVDKLGDKVLGYLGGQVAANAGFLGLDVIHRGPEAVLNKDYLFASLASNVAFGVADIPRFRGRQYIGNPVDKALTPTQDQINAEKTRSERTRESLEAIDNSLAKFQKEAELGVDIGRFISKNNEVAATMEGHRKSITLAAKEFKAEWDKYREVKPQLPDVFTGIDPKVLLKNASVIDFAPARTLVEGYKQKLQGINKVKGRNLSRIAKSDADLERVMGLVEEDLKLPDTLLSTPVTERTVEQYQKALGTKLSDNAVKLIRMKHMEIAQGENFVPEFPKLWEEHNKALTGKFEGSIDDRYELITASLLATGRFPKVVKAQKKAVAKAKAEGLTQAEAAKDVTDTLGAVAKPKKKRGRKPGRTQATVSKNEEMNARIIRAAEAPSVKVHKFADNDEGPAQPPVDDDTFFIAANLKLSPEPERRIDELNWLYNVFVKHARLNPADRLAKFEAGLKTLARRARSDNPIKTTLFKEEITPDQAILTPGDEADLDALVAERKLADEQELTDILQDDIVEAIAEEVEAPEALDAIEAKPVIDPVKARDTAVDYMLAISKKYGKPLSREQALNNLMKMTPGVRGDLLDTAVNWDQAKRPQLAARDIDPRTVNIVTGQPLPIKEFATAWAREAGVPEAEIPATVDDFVRITQMFAAGEARFGTMAGVTKEGAQFARASAGAFDFGMREVKNGQLQRPGKPPLGTKDGWMLELDFRNNGGDINGVLSKDEVNFYRELVPEAFKDGKVHLQKLWDGLGKAGEQVKVVTYGQGGLISEAKAKFDEAIGELDRLGFEWGNNEQTQLAKSSEMQKWFDQAVANREEANKVSSGPRATSYYNQISPFDTKKFPVVRVDVVLPVRTDMTGVDPNAPGSWQVAESRRRAGGELWKPDNLHENLPNTLGWAMVQIVPHPVTGEKVMFVGEAQSRWGQEVQKQQREFETWKRDNPQIESPELYRKHQVANHPLLPVHQNLILKSVIKEAQKQGISKVAVSDGETAMMTEGHDKSVRAEFNKAAQTELESKGYRIETTKFDDGSTGHDVIDPTGKPAGYIDFGTDYIGTDPVVKAAIQSNARPSQEGGMRLAYDTTLPSIMSKLVGEGKVEDFGVHKNAIKEGNDPATEARYRAEDDRALAEGRMTREEYQANRDYAVPGSPVFRTPSGTPKTNATARVFDISNPSDRLNTLFAKGGTVYGAAFKGIAQAFFSTKAFQGPNKTKAMAFVLAHENAHIAFGKAMRGEYGQETKQLFDEAIAWVKTNDPVVLRDVEEIIRELYLPKEMKNLDGVRDVLGNLEPEEWMANAHAMMVTGAMQANKPIKALLLLPKPIRTMVENTIRRVQDALKHARMYWKLSGDKNKMGQVLRVKDMVDSVRQKFREAEWQTAQAIKFLDVDSAGLWNRMQDAQFARSPYPTEGWSKQWVGKVFNNATMGLGGFMGTYKSFVEPGFLLQGSDRIVTAQVAESLTPIFGHKGATDNIVIDKSLPWYKIADSPPLKDLAKRINLEAQDMEMSAFVRNPDGTVSFNWNAMSPKHRAEVKLYDPARQKLMATFLMQKEQSTRITQKNTVGHETARAKMFAVNLVTKLKSFDQGSAPAVRHKEARVVAERLFDAMQTGDQIAMKEAMSRFADPNEARKLVEIIQDKQTDLAGLTKLYAERPNFQSLRRFKPIIQRYTNPAGEKKTLDFNTGTESEAMKKELIAKGWTPVGDPIIKELDNKYKNEFTLDSKVVDLIEGKQGRLKDLINSIDMDPADRNELLGETSFLEDVLRETKANEVYKPGVKRRISGGPEHLDLMEQHLTYTQAAHKVGYMTALGEELKYHMNNPELKDQHREKMQFMEFYKQAKDSDPKFWRTVNKAMAVWHIGGNLPGHLAELFQPFQTSIHQAVAQGHSMLTSLRTVVGAERDAAKVAGKLIKSKIGYHDDAAIWVNWPDKDEAAMLKENYGRSITQSTQEIYQQVGVNQESLRSVVQDRTMPSVSKSLLKPFNMWANASMGFYSLFTQHNNLVGLLTGYRLAKKKGLSHEDAVKDARLFELTTNNSGGRTERPVYFGKLGHAGYLVYGLSSFVRGRFTDLAKYYRHGFDKVNFPELNQADRRAARKAFATMISGQLAAAGILGFPFIGPGLALMEDLTGEELKGSGMVALNEMTDDPLLTQALSYGVFSSMAEGMGIPADLHSRFALSGFLGVNAYDGVSASSVLGPTASMVNSMWKMGKSLVQEHDLSKALQAGGPGGVKKMMEALSEDFQSENPDANLPMAMAGFRSGKMFKHKETERIISKTLEAAQNDIKLAAKKVEESLLLGPEVAQKTLMREANLLIDQRLEGRGRQVALKDMMSNLRQRIALQKVKEQMPSDLRGKATAQTASKVSNIAQAVGYQPPPAGNVEQEQIMRTIYQQLGAQRSPGSMRRARERQMELEAQPWTFY